jgi:hypothetical protein
VTWRLLYADVIEDGERIINVSYTNGMHMGEMIMAEDGYFVWFPITPGRGGFIEAWVLRELADKLDDVNREWDEKVRRELGSA